MLQEILKNIQSSLKSYNQGLAKQNMLIDIPWTMVDGDLNIQRLIFRKDNSLYIVKEGEIQESKWEYLTSLDSLVLELGGKKILLNEVYSDEKALILKKDGTSQDFLAFANQHKLPDLNLIAYFNAKAIENQQSTSNLNQELYSTSKKDVYELWIIMFLFISFLIILIAFSKI
jgi:hypothetical protein